MIGHDHVDASARAAAVPSTLAMPLSTVTITCGDSCAASATISQRQSVAILKAVGHDVANLGAHRPQAAGNSAAVAPSAS